MTYHVKIVHRNCPKWDESKFPTILDFVTSFPEHDIDQINKNMEFVNSLPVVGVFRPADPALGDDDTVSWVSDYEILNFNKAADDGLSIAQQLAEHIETRLQGTWAIAHNLTMEITISQT